MTEIFIVDALRTGIGNLNGSLSGLSAVELGTNVISNILSRNAIEPQNISQIIMGQVLTTNCGQNPARQSAIRANVPYEVPAMTINQVCGSGLRAIFLAAQAIKLGDDDIIIAGGQESMSSAPHAAILRSGIKMGEVSFKDTMIYDGLWDVFNNYHMGNTAENIAEKYNISRVEQDEFALRSQQKAKQAQDQGKFADEIVPINIHKKKETLVFEKDEFIKAGANIESLSSIKPVFKKDGSVTAGNASGINDGAACVLVVSEGVLKKLNKTPLARIVSYAHFGVDPKIMGTGPIGAVKLALKKANWKIDDLDLIESNEAFAAQAIAVNKELRWNTDLINVNGGAIALGHPIGASGARIVTTLLHEMQRIDAKKAIATLCVGGGMGVAMCFARD